MTFPSAITRQAEEILALASARNATLVTAESCTGGLIIGALTEIPGSSLMVDRGFITYSNNAKTEMLGVSAQTLADHGAVSEQTAREMVRGALTRSPASHGVAVTGIAGPAGGSPDKPVGLVCFGLGHRPEPDTEPVITTQTVVFEDKGRAAIRMATVRHALSLLIDALSA